MGRNQFLTAALVALLNATGAQAQIVDPYTADRNYYLTVIFLSIILVLILAFTLGGMLNMDAGKENDTILYAKFLTHVEDKVK